MDPTMQRLDAHLDYLAEEDERRTAFEELRLAATINDVCLWTAHKMRLARAKMEMDQCPTT